MVAVLLALASGITWGTADFFGGLLTKRIFVVVVVAVNQLVAAVLLLAVAAATGAWHADLGYLPWALVWGVFGPLSLAAFYRALAIGTMGVVSPIAATGIVVPVVAGLVQGERPNGWQITAIVVTAIGVVLVGGPDVRTDDDGTREHGWRPIGLALVAALGFGSSYVFMAEGSQYSVIMTLAAQRSMSAAVSFAVLLVVVGRLRLSRRDLLRIAGVGAGDVAANALFGWSSTLGLLSITAVFGSLYPVMTSFLAWRLLHERLSPLQKIGVALAMTGVVGLSAAGA